MLLPYFLLAQENKYIHPEIVEIELFNAGIQSLREFLLIPNLGSDKEHVKQNVAWCQQVFSDLDFQTRVLVTAEVPVLIAEKKSSTQPAKTILFYLQIDGQPVVPDEWSQENPFHPVIKKPAGEKWEIIPWDSLTLTYQPHWRIFGRSTSDSKGNVIAFITALRKMKAEGKTSDYNIKVIMDFQEELGSPTLPRAVMENKSVFSADWMIILDGTRHVSNLPTLTFGARGILSATLRVFGPSNPMHSGQYGNFVPNPVFALSRLIAGMKDEDGRVLIPGFYDAVQLDSLTKNLLSAVPDNKEALLSGIGIAKPEKVGDSFQESLQYPSLNIKGISAAKIGKLATTIIPDEAIAEFDIRLVPETPAEKMITLFTHYVKNAGFHLVEEEPSPEERKKYAKLAFLSFRIGSKAYRTDMNSTLGKWVEQSMQKVFGNSYVKVRSTGGSQPISPFITTLGIPALAVNIPNPDNNIHAADENLTFHNFMEGIRICYAILNEKVTL
jgi:acetylornithine deacetylase/succinyl-diaminopimelate desuccinylase-like protein